MAVVIEEADNPKGLAFVMHGNASNKDLVQIKTFARVFLDNGYTVVRFDTTNSSGESDGQLEDATLTNYYEDLEDVISWASRQSFYKEPFILCGHSLGGMAVALFAEKYPEKIKALAPISVVISGELSEQTQEFKEIGLAWKEKGIREWPSVSMPGMMKRLKWNHVVDKRKYDILPEANKLTMPVLMIVGELDDVTPLEHQKLLYEKLPGEKELHVIKGSGHSFIKQGHLDEIKEIMGRWAVKIINL
ncbi:MAG: alpha/beta hydrolase [Patescibacteria group bacterium]|nr:alpha/beta hydrolase [Patescibacteria group bacterium]